MAVLRYEYNPTKIINKGGDSGKVHSTVRDRWEKKDPNLISGMLSLGQLADEGTHMHMYMYIQIYISLITLIITMYSTMSMLDSL